MALRYGPPTLIRKGAEKAREMRERRREAKIGER